MTGVKESESASEQTFSTERLSELLSDASNDIPSPVASSPLGTAIDLPADKFKQFFDQQVRSFFSFSNVKGPL